MAEIQTGNNQTNNNHELPANLTQQLAHIFAKEKSQQMAIKYISLDKVNCN